MLSWRALLYPSLNNRIESSDTITPSSVLSVQTAFTQALKPTPVLTLLQSIVEALLSSLVLQWMPVTHHGTPEPGTPLR